jgi:hypothetical protein
MMNFIAILARLAKIETAINDVINRTHPIQLAIVTDNNDPSGERRIRVTREIQGSQSQSYWIQCGRSTSFTDEPLPPIGTPVLIALVGGDPHDVYFLRTLSNQKNPPDKAQSNPIKDNTIEIPGDERKSIRGNLDHDVSGAETRNIDGNLTITVNGGNLSIDSTLGRIDINALDSVNITNESGASIRLMEDGSVLIADKFGKILTWGGGNGTIYNWNMNGANFTITNAANASINGKQIATIGAQDSRGDNLTTRGW